MREIPEYEAPYSTIAYYREPHYDGSKPGEYFVQHVQARDAPALRARGADVARIDPRPSPADRDRARARRAAAVSQARRLDGVRRGLGAVHGAPRRGDGPVFVRSRSDGQAQLRRVARVAACRRYRLARSRLVARRGGGLHARAHGAHRHQHRERGRSLHRLARAGARVQVWPARDPRLAPTPSARSGRASISRRSTRSSSARAR